MPGPLFFNRVKENTATVGTGTISLAGVPAGGFFPFSNVGSGNTCKYTIDDGLGNVEVGQGTYTAAGNTLSRDSVETSTNANALVNFGAGNKTIWLDVPATFFSSVPTSVVNDTNVTGTLSGNVLTLGWTGTLASARVSTLNQNTTGSAATLTTPRAIYGNNFDGSAALAQVIASTFGGTGNGFTKFSGPATSEKTFTLPDTSATILTSNAVVTVAQGGIGVGILAVNGVLYGNTTSAVQALAVNSTATNKFLTQSSSAAPAWSTMVAGDLPANGANPSASLGLSAINGSATTWMRSDGAPALDVTIIPSWSGAHTFTNKSAITITQAVIATAAPSTPFTVMTGAHTSLTAGNNFIAGMHDALTNQPQWATGTLASLTPWVFKGVKPKFVGSSTVTAYSTVDINSAGDATGTNCSGITANYFLTCGGTSAPVFSVNSAGAITIANLQGIILDGGSNFNFANKSGYLNIGSLSGGAGTSFSANAGNVSSVGWGMINGTQFGVVSGSTIGFANATGDARVLDAGWSRLGPGLTALGNGTNGDFSGSLKFTILTLQGKTTTYNAVATVGMGVVPLYGLDNRTGLTSADGAPITLYTTTAANQIYRVSADIFATAFTSGTATYTIAWTENGTAQTMSVTSTILNTLGTATNMIRPDNATAITAQLTGTFVGTFTLVGAVEKIA